MTIRTTETTVIFSRPFLLSSVEGQQPPGTYRLVIDEEEIPGLSFLAYQRVATMLHLPAIDVINGLQQVFRVDPVELTSALEADVQL